MFNNKNNVIILARRKLAFNLVSCLVFRKGYYKMEVTLLCIHGSNINSVSSG